MLHNERRYSSLWKVTYATMTAGCRSEVVAAAATQREA